MSPILSLIADRLRRWLTAGHDEAWAKRALTASNVPRGGPHCTLDGHQSFEIALNRLAHRAVRGREQSPLRHPRQSNLHSAR